MQFTLAFDALNMALLLFTLHSPRLHGWLRLSRTVIPRRKRTHSRLLACLLGFLTPKPSSKAFLLSCPTSSYNPHSHCPQLAVLGHAGSGLRSDDPLGHPKPYILSPIPSRSAPGGNELRDWVHLAVSHTGIRKLHLHKGEMGMQGMQGSGSRVPGSGFRVPDSERKDSGASV
jgi:hypothetical protein